MAELNQRWGGGRHWRAVPRFALHQHDRIRPIDDASRGGHNGATCMSEKIVLCNSGQPALDARALRDAAEKFRCADQLLRQELETGGEDMPNTFMTVPCDPGDQSVNSTVMYDPSPCSWRFQELWSLMKTARRHG